MATKSSWLTCYSKRRFSTIYYSGGGRDYNGGRDCVIREATYSRRYKIPEGGLFLRVGTTERDAGAVLGRRPVAETEIRRYGPKRYWSNKRTDNWTDRDARSGAGAIIDSLRPRTSSHRSNSIGFDSVGRTSADRRVHAVRYDTIRDAILTCARKPTRVSLIYRTEPTTKKCKNRRKKLKVENRYAQK